MEGRLSRVFKKAYVIFQNVVQFSGSKKEPDADSFAGCRYGGSGIDGDDDGLSGYSGADGA